MYMFLFFSRYIKSSHQWPERFSSDIKHILAPSNIKESYGIDKELLPPTDSSDENSSDTNSSTSDNEGEEQSGYNSDAEESNDENHQENTNHEK